MKVCCAATITLNSTISSPKNLFTRGRSAAIILLYNLRCRLWLLSIVPLALNTAACTISYKELFWQN